jgi:hypothetical protein
MTWTAATTRALHPRRLAIGLAALLLAAASAAHAEPPRPTSRLKITTDGSVSETGSAGRIAVTAPVRRANDGGLILDLHGRDDERGSSEFDLGTGYRHRFDSGWDVGAQTSIDRHQSTGAVPLHQVDVGVDARRGAVAVNAGAFARAVADDTAGADVTGGRLNLQTRWLSLTASRSISRTGHELDGEVGRTIAPFGRDSGVGVDLFAGAFQSEADGVEPRTGRRGRMGLRVDRLDLLGHSSSLSMNGRVEDDGVADPRLAAELRLNIPM